MILRRHISGLRILGVKVLDSHLALVKKSLGLDN